MFRGLCVVERGGGRDEILQMGGGVDTLEAGGAGILYSIAHSEEEHEGEKPIRCLVLWSTPRRKR